MNNRYYIVNNSAIIFDENNNEKIISNTDNLEEILIEENLHDYISKTIEDYQISKKLCSKYKKNIKYLIIFMLIFLITGLIEGTNIFSIIITFLFSETIACLGYNHFKKQENAYNLAIPMLEKKLEESEIKLNDLQNFKKVIQNEKETEKIIVNDREKLESFKEYLNMLHDYSYNESKYIKYYQENKLHEILENKYSEEEIKTLEEYLKTKIEEQELKLELKKNL